MIRLSILAVSLLYLVQCSSTPDLKEVNRGAQNILQEADALMKEGKVAESARLLSVLKQLHPNDKEIQSKLDGLSAEQKKALEDDPWLGFNKSKRAMEEPAPDTTTKVLYYIPDRIFDFIDMFSVEGSLGAQLGGGVWFTRALQGVAFVGTTAGIGYYQKKQLGFRTEGSVDLAIGPVGGTAIAGLRVGTGGIDTTARAIYFHKPSHPLYQEYRDYWAIGGKIGIFFFGLEFEYHPVEIYDFLLGIAVIDPMNDDLATTKRLRFSDAQETYLQTYMTQVSKMNEEKLEEYKKSFVSVKGGASESPAPAKEAPKGKK